MKSNNLYFGPFVQIKLDSSRIHEQKCANPKCESNETTCSDKKISGFCDKCGFKLVTVVGKLRLPHEHWEDNKPFEHNGFSRFHIQDGSIVYMPDDFGLTIPDTATDFISHVSINNIKDSGLFDVKSMQTKKDAFLSFLSDNEYDYYIFQGFISYSSFKITKNNNFY